MKKMVKTLIPVVLAAVMAVAVLGGCKQKFAEVETTEVVEVETTTEAETEEPTTWAKSEACVPEMKPCVLDPREGPCKIEFRIILPEHFNRICWDNIYVDFYGDAGNVYRIQCNMENDYIATGWVPADTYHYSFCGVYGDWYSEYVFEQLNPDTFKLDEQGKTFEIKIQDFDKWDAEIKALG